MNNLTFKKKISIGAAGLSIVLGLSLLHFYPSIFNHILRHGMTLTPTSRSFQLWKANPMPMHLDFYLFNWTNPEDIHNASIKPRFVEVGPFRFKENTEKVNISWNDNNTISYYNNKLWEFDRETSAFDLDVNITTINVVSVSGAFQARYWGFWSKKAFQFSLGQFAPKLQITRTAGEFIFVGYEDIFVTISKKLAITGLPATDRVGWFYGRNNSKFTEGYNNMDLSFENMGKLRSWNNKTTTPGYDGECGKIGGSAGAFYKRNTEKTKIGFYSTDLCRQIVLDYEEDREVFGFDGYKFSASKSLLDNGQQLPENKCYCNGECLPYGMLNVSRCQYNSPSFVSMPHFYNADPYYASLVEGLTPTKSEHDFYIVLEPTTGTPLSVAARLQFNLLIQPVQYITLFEGVPKLYFPVMWFQQVVDLPESERFGMKILLSLPSAMKVCAYSLLAIGILTIALILFNYRSANSIKLPKRRTDDARENLQLNEATKEIKQANGIDDKDANKQHNGFEKNTDHDKLGNGIKKSQDKRSNGIEETKRLLI